MRNIITKTKTKIKTSKFQVDKICQLCSGPHLLHIFSPQMHFAKSKNEKRGAFPSFRQQGTRMNVNDIDNAFNCILDRYTQNKYLKMKMEMKCCYQTKLNIRLRKKSVHNPQKVI